MNGGGGGTGRNSPAGDRVLDGGASPAAGACTPCIGATVADGLEESAGGTGESRRGATGRHSESSLVPVGAGKKTGRSADEGDNVRASWDATPLARGFMAGIFPKGGTGKPTDVAIVGGSEPWLGNDGVDTRWGTGRHCGSSAAIATPSPPIQLLTLTIATHIL